MCNNIWMYLEEGLAAKLVEALGLKESDYSIDHYSEVVLLTIKNKRHVAKVREKAVMAFPDHNFTVQDGVGMLVKKKEAAVA